MFTFLPLDLTPELRQIRFLNLLPASSFDAAISCTIFNGSLEAPPHYEALSYVWGTESDKLKINLVYDDAQENAACKADIEDTGLNLEVTQNLASALRHIRDVKSSRILWIDAICIDQNSTKEKSHQVAQMRQVYLSAHRVIMWLGPESSFSSSLAIEFLRSMPMGKDGEPQYVYQEADSPAWLACDDLFLKRPYWSRSWILQEVLHNRPVTVHVGQNTLEIDPFFDLFNKYFTLRKVLSSLSMSGLSAEEQKQLSKDPEKLKKVLANDQWFREFGATESMPASLVYFRPLFQNPKYLPRLGYLLNTFRDQLATVPKDKIYSLSGMAEQEYDIEINYNEDPAKGATLSTRELYMQTTRQLLAKVLVVLLWIESPQRKIESGLDGIRLPSWVPGFMTEQHLNARCLYTKSPLFCASKDFPGGMWRDQSTDKEDALKKSGIFTIRGVRVGRIRNVKEVHATTKWSDVETAQGWDKLRLFWYEPIRHVNGMDLEISNEAVPEDVMKSATFENTSWGPCKSEREDIIVVAAGSNIPLVLRKKDEMFLFVGGCWLVKSQINLTEMLEPQNTSQQKGFDEIMYGSIVKEIESCVIEKFDLC
ncbi:heterokaryon incompatibility protein [Glarea lozoyensis ATCC 20868]|uniref:Heterokaryon incompatibility protein n=1 Tax=Glarea lozoyensis (strain ATCC 20868 / MF5171) TaxID=1116229 RepID=S3CWJ9_GLAL2|nr:heterokaryon incompatibility protein [Glarea lozoyensis ATCC 20868]EPE24201.1 heterokaryon incompatibility protein [Glarea lozoyensis ATCC 20868]